MVGICPACGGASPTYNGICPSCRRLDPSPYTLRRLDNAPIMSDEDTTLVNSWRNPEPTSSTSLSGSANQCSKLGCTSDKAPGSDKCYLHKWD